jgi:hypothetical protein
MTFVLAYKKARLNFLNNIVQKTQPKNWRDGLHELIRLELCKNLLLNTKLYPQNSYQLLKVI